MNPTAQPGPSVTDAAAPPSLLERLRCSWSALAEELFDRDGLDTVFSHARNVLTGTVIVAAGLYAIHHAETVPIPGMWTVHAAGYGVTLLGAVLLLLNLADGLRRLARKRHSLALRAVTILAYLAISVRLTQVIVYFRSAL